MALNRRKGVMVILSVLGCATVLAMVLVTSCDSADAFQLPDTGQTTCWDTLTGQTVGCAGTGQDGEFSINPMSFTDNGNGTVMDNNTGLFWQKCAVGQSDYTACASTPMPYNWYQASGTYDPANNASSQNVCGSLNLGGYATGWRLPTIQELQSIMDYSVQEPGQTIQTTFFPGTASHQYWASDSVYSTQYAYYMFYYMWGTNPNWGGVKSDNHIVKCVHGAHTTPGFKDNGNGTVTDAGTGLMWQQGDVQDYLTWDAALSYCSSLVLPNGSYGDWRMPNMKELMSIFDTTKVFPWPSIDMTFFPGARSDLGYWSSTSTVIQDLSGSVDAWTVYFGFLSPGPGYWSKESDGFEYVRCVRQVGFARFVHGVTPSSNYTTLNAAYIAAAEGDTIQAQAVDFAETRPFSRNVSVVLAGGYDSGFNANSGFTTVGNLTISGGKVTIDKVVIK